MKKLIIPIIMGSMAGGAFLYKTLKDKHLNISFNIEGGFNDETMN